MRIKFWDKLRSLKDVFVIEVGEDQAELADSDVDKDRKREVRTCMDKKLIAIADLEGKKWDFAGKVVTALGSVAAAVVGTKMIIDWNDKQYDRNDDPNDQRQMDLNHNTNSSKRVADRFLKIK